jgi:hypothetical protein
MSDIFEYQNSNIRAIGRFENKYRLEVKKEERKNKNMKWVIPSQINQRIKKLATMTPIFMK